MSKEVRLYGGLTPYKHQLDLHNIITEYLNEDVKEQKMIIIKAARQRYAKSTAMKAELLRFSLHSEYTVNAYVSPTLKLAKKMYNEIVSATTELIHKQNSIDLYIEFINGSTIRFFSAEMGNALRGFTVTGLLVIDEAAFVKDDVYYELISSWCTVHKALTILVSTPQYFTGFYYNFYLKGLCDNKSFITLDWVKDYNMPFDDFTLSLRDNMPKSKWLSEYCGLFLQFESSVFGDFKDCILDYKPEYKSLYWGIDFATGSSKDYTVLTAFNELGEQCYTWRTNDMQPNEQINKLIDILNEYKPYTKKIIAEVNSIGKVYIDLLKKSIPNITSFITTNDSKRKLVEQFQTAIENNKVKLCNDNILFDELTYYEATRNEKTNSISYNAKSGFNDDYLMATMLAYEAYNKKSNYKFSII